AARRARGHDRARPGLRPYDRSRRRARRLPGDERPRGAQGPRRALALDIGTQVRVYSASTMRIGEVARRAGVNVETLRYYERRGLLDPPGRGGNGDRQHSDETG